MRPFFKKMREARRPRCAAVVAAAGSSSRMGGVNKLLQPLDGVPVLVRTLGSSKFFWPYGLTKCAKVIRGGESRVHSALLAALEVSPETELLAVHDGARPLVTPELIDRVVSAAARCSAAAPAVPVKDTVKVVRDGKVESTPDRDTLRAIQTPQAFDGPLLRAALQAAAEAGAEVTDDCAAVERLGKEVYLADGSYENIKITTPEDLALAEAILQRREGQV